MYPWPKCSTVTCVELPNQDFEPTDPNSGKRSRWSSPEVNEPAAQKRARSHFPEETDESDFTSDEDEVQKMIIDESFSQKPRSRSKPTGREKVKVARLQRWAKNRTVRAACEERVQETIVPAGSSFSMRVDSEGTLPSQSTAQPTKERFKRKGRFRRHTHNQTLLHGL